MKKINKLLCLLIGICIILSTFSFKLERVVIDTINYSYVKKELVYITRSINVPKEYKNSNIYLEIEETIKNSKVIDNITEIYYENLINSLKNNTILEIPNINKELDSLVDSLSYITEKTNLSKEEIKDIIVNFIDKDGINNKYMKYGLELKEQYKDNKLVKLYNIFTSNILKTILLSLTVILMTLLVVLNKLKYTLLNSIGLTLLVSGLIIVGVIPRILFEVDPLVTAYIRLDKINTLSYIYIIVGFISMIIYNIIDFVKIKKIKRLSK